MMPTFIRRAAIAVGVTALVAASTVLGSTAAQAGSPLNDCSDPATVGTLIDAQTPGAWWYDVCINTSVIGEGETTNKTDAFDDFGYISVEGYPDPVAAIPTSYGYVGSDYVIEFTDAGYDLGGLTGVVDIVVTQTFSGTFVSWKVEFFETGTNIAVLGLPIRIGGNLGCDSDCLYGFDGDQLVVTGDFNDPIIMWQINTDYIWNAVDFNDNLDVQALSGGTLTMSLVDFGCEPLAPTSYVSDILDDGLSTHFGESLQIPGTENCLTVGGPLNIVGGRAFSYVVPITFTSPAWNFTGGGFAESDFGPDFVDNEELNSGVPGIEPGLRVFGTAPSAAGTYQVPVYAGDGEGLTSRGFLTINVSAPTLAATGTDVVAPLAGGVLATALGALVLLVVRRRSLTSS